MDKPSSIKLQSERNNTAKICGTVDAAALELFKQEAKKEMRSDSSMLNIILTERYANQKPKK